MSRLQSIVLLGALLLCTALGAGLDPVRVGRYSAIVLAPSPEQADPLALRVDTEFRARMQTVGRVLEQVLVPSGYRLARLNASCPSLTALLGLPLPAERCTESSARCGSTRRSRPWRVQPTISGPGRSTGGSCLSQPIPTPV